VCSQQGSRSLSSCEDGDLRAKSRDEEKTASVCHQGCTHHTTFTHAPHASHTWDVIAKTHGDN
jgi:hypothetical protein